MKIVSKADAKAAGLKHYYTGKPCKNGHLDKRYVSSGSCAECERTRLRLRYSKNPDKYRNDVKRYQSENRDKVLERKRAHLEENREAINARRRELRPRHAEKNSKINAEYREKNRDKILRQKRRHYRENRDKYRKWNRDWHGRNPGAQGEYIRRRSADDPTYAVMRSVRDMVRRCVFRNGESATKIADSLGYSKEELVAHLERQFTEGMSWENYGEWHIDHIVPVSAHIKAGETDPAVINCLTNLQPLWAEDNLRKGGRREKLL